MHKNPIIRIWLLGALLLFISVACQRITFPAVSDTQEEMYRHGAIVWHDLITPDAQQSKKFYQEVFGWEFNYIGTEENPYREITYNGKNVGGMIEGPTGQNNSGEWIGSISVPSVKSAVNRSMQAGGDQLGKTLKLNGRGTSALVRDNSGAVFGLLHSSTGDPSLVEADYNEWLWHELWSTDPAAAKEFYSKIIGYSFEEEDHSGVDYWTMVKDGNVECGLLENPVENIRSVWVPYIRVNDAKRYAEKAETMGARVLMMPRTDIRKGSVSVIMDPTGAPIALQEWPI